MNTTTLPLQAQWQRHSLSEKGLRWFITLLLVAAIVQSLRYVEVIPEFLLDAPEQMGDMVQRMFPIDWAHYADGVHNALMETLHIATLGTAIGLLLALPLGLMVARNVCPIPALNLLARVVLVSSRSVNSLVWALLFVKVFGPGALAGVAAIAFRSIGFMGKLIGEAVEETPRGPIEALKASGAGVGAQLLYGYFPHLRPTFWSVVLLRWDINIRESAVLGLVGAGGIGMALDTALNLFQWDRVSLVIATILAVVVLAEVVVTLVRRRVV